MNKKKELFVQHQTKYSIRLWQVISVVCVCVILVKLHPIWRVCKLPKKCTKSDSNFYCHPNPTLNYKIFAIQLKFRTFDVTKNTPNLIFVFVTIASKARQVKVFS